MNSLAMTITLRVVFGAILFVGVLFFPWWLTVLAMIFGVILFPWYIEAIFFGLLIDVLYAGTHGAEPFGSAIFPPLGFPFTFTLLALIVVITVSLLKNMFSESL